MSTSNELREKMDRRLEEVRTGPLTAKEIKLGAGSLTAESLQLELLYNLAVSAERIAGALDRIAGALDRLTLAVEGIRDEMIAEKERQVYGQ